MQDHVTTGSSNFMGGSRSSEVDILSSLVDKGTVILEVFLVCQVISQGHVIEASCDFMDKSPSG